MIKTPFGPVGQIVYKRTYSRKLTEDTYEEFPDTIDRILTACDTQLQCGFSKEDEEELRGFFLSLKGSVAGRFLWQLGTETVDRLGLLSLQNCAVTAVDHPIRPFTWTFDALMLGCGVGFNIQREYVYQIPKVKGLSNKEIARKDTYDADFIVPDSREGWVELLRRVLKSYFYTGKAFTYSSVCIRGKGAPIKGFGGVASGPEELCEGIAEICRILNERVNKKLRPIDCLDIMNVIGSIVVAGNVRRSAQIAIGDADDFQFLNAKRWDLGSIPNYRAMSNNSVVCNDFEHLPDAFWKGYQGNGEPYGLINLKLARSCGRLGEKQYKDKLIVGFNPCFGKGTLIKTNNGLFPIEQLIGQDVKVWDGVNWAQCDNFRVTGTNREMLRITLHDGSELRVTKNHSCILENGDRIEAGSLQTGMRLATQGIDTYSTRENEPGAYLKGFLIGDGHLTDNRPHLMLYGPKYTCEERLVKSAQEIPIAKINTNALIDVKFEQQTPVRKILKGLTVRDVKLYCSEYKEVFPLDVFQWSHFSQREFIAGVMDADGSALDSKHGFGYQISSISKDWLAGFQSLLKMHGVQSTLRLNKQAERRVLPGGIYETKDLYRLTVSQANAITLSGKVNFSRLVSFKDRTCTYTIKPKWNVVASVTNDGIDEEVYCCTVDSTHSIAIGIGLQIGQCGEQGLEDKETCCLADVFLPNITSYKELCTVSRYLYIINKHSLMLNCHHQDTESVVHKNMRMGIGITGYLQATEEQRSWLSNCYEFLRAFDEEYSRARGWPISIKITTCKPSGTLSLLPGVTPGVHPAIFQFFIRRIQMAANSDLVQQCFDAGYKVEPRYHFDGKIDHTTSVVEFPCSYPEGTILAKDTTAVQQLEYVKRLQTEWSDNAVSCTVYYRKEELPEIKAWLAEHYNSSVKTVSFLLHQEHGFKQAPYEEITREEYSRLIKRIRPISQVNDGGIESDFECSMGACPVK